MEGEFDVITAYKEGIVNAVALKGTAFTENQAFLFSRFASKVALCLDQDSAGMQAMERSLPILEKRGLLITVINSRVKIQTRRLKENPIVFKKSVKNQEEVYDFLIKKYITENDANSAMGKKNITDKLFH